MIHFFFLLDTSSSMGSIMYGVPTPIQALNKAMPNLLPSIQKVCDDNGVTPLIHVLAFNSCVRWLCGTTATVGIEAKDIVWNDLTAYDTNNTADAIVEILEGLQPRYLDLHAHRPVILLITDGYSIDSTATIAAVNHLIARCPKSIRIVVDVNDYDCHELEVFASPAIVTITDHLGDTVASREQKLIFHLNRVDQLVDTLRMIVISVSVTSIQIGKGGDRDPSVTEIILPDYDDVLWL